MTDNLENVQMKAVYCPFVFVSKIKSPSGAEAKQDIELSPLAVVKLPR